MSNLIALIGLHLFLFFRFVVFVSRVSIYKDLKEIMSLCDDAYYKRKHKEALKKLENKCGIFINYKPVFIVYLSYVIPITLVFYLKSHWGSKIELETIGIVSVSLLFSFESLLNKFSSTE